MMNLPLGMILLLIVSVLVYFGIAQRILDRMRLTDKQALFFILAVFVGSYINIPIMNQPTQLSVNVGGAILPALLCFYLIYKADSNTEKVRAVAAAALVAFTVFLGTRFLSAEPETMFLDPKIIYGVSAGIIAYLAGRSRRSAFIGGVLGIIISDIVHFITLSTTGISGITAIGGAGAFDVIMISGIVAVMVAELVGETREKLQGGPVLGPNRPSGLYEFSKDLTNRIKRSREENRKTASNSEQDNSNEPIESQGENNNDK